MPLPIVRVLREPLLLDARITSRWLRSSLSRMALGEIGVSRFHRLRRHLQRRPGIDSDPNFPRSYVGRSYALVDHEPRANALIPGQRSSRPCRPDGRPPTREPTAKPPCPQRVARSHDELRPPSSKLCAAAALLRMRIAETRDLKERDLDSHPVAAPSRTTEHPNRSVGAARYGAAPVRHAIHANKPRRRCAASYAIARRKQRHKPNPAGAHEPRGRQRAPSARIPPDVPQPHRSLHIYSSFAPASRERDARTTNRSHVRERNHALTHRRHRRLLAPADAKRCDATLWPSCAPPRASL